MCRFIAVLLVMCASLTIAGGRDDRGRDARDDARLPMVYNAQGKAVGPLEYFAGVNGVYIAIDGEPVFVIVDHKRLGPLQYSASEYEWVATQSAGYASTDCSGSVQVPLSASPTPAIAVRDGVDVTVYTAVGGSTGNVHVWSLRQTDSSGATSCSPTQFDEGSLYWAVRSSYPLTQRHPEPLRIAF
ncbi:hypothetical protein AWB75_05275 [Caballeronia catudaia]|uniref:Uncharacterized protein n=1 Tax=Caballeronia catudaia TaxID=1777136 RepID=A0A158CL58_9BURK|nr:hypothetical protein [Caballeronia catudaia]SAK82616.1 hypothetical protein AWB75_05275 [Caballeronia catudaia]